MVDQLSKEQIREFQECFSLFTKNKASTVTARELGSVMRSLGQNLSPAQLQAMIQEADRDGDGAIDFADFLSLMAKKMKEADVEEELLATFQMFDKDRNGLISAVDFRRVIASLGESLTYQEVEDIIRMADGDKDGYITYEEFVRVLRG